MSEKIAVVLELTTGEARMLRTVLMHGVAWAESGKFGKCAGEVHCALDEIDIKETTDRVLDRGAWPAHRVWK